MSAGTTRLAWVDNLRTASIILVVNMHACVTYSHVGSWYVNETPEPDFGTKVVFVLWQAGLQSFFMGVLFFVAGFFAHQSLVRHGTGRFLRDRLFRLGLPALVYMGIIHPFMVYVLLGRARTPGAPALGSQYWTYLVSGRVLHGSGPLWFVLALLLFSAALAGWWVLGFSSVGKEESRQGPAPSGGTLLGVAVMLGLATFAVRGLQPLGTDVLNFQLGYFPQYVVAFAGGVLAARDRWLEALAEAPTARVAGWLGVAGGPSLLATLILLGGAPPETGPNPYAGGADWRAFGLALWEQLAGLGLGLGMLALFRRRLPHAGRVARWLSARSFGVYVLHAPVLVALTPLLRPLGAGPFTKALVLTVLGVLASFAAAELARRTPGLKRIL